MLRVITRCVSPSISRCELTCIEREAIDQRRIVEQHGQYVNVFVKLRDRGFAISVTELPPLDAFPDSMFVEDVALVFPECAVVTRPGAITRRGETEHIVEPLVTVMKGRPVFHIEEPATMDGGDILVVDHHVFVGNSTRTNEEGFLQLKSALAPFGYTVTLCRVNSGCLHLKSAASMLTLDTVLVNASWIDPSVFTQVGLKVVTIDNEREPGSANVLSFVVTTNDGSAKRRMVVVPTAYPTLKGILDQWAHAQGEETIVIHDISVDEIAKAEGALTCCSLLCVS